MAWTDPRSWVAEEVVTANQMNTHVRDNLEFLYERVSVTSRTNSTAQPIANSTVGPVTWQTEVKTDDPLGDYTYQDTGGTETRIITINRDGWYRVEAGVFWQSNATGRRFVEISDSGTVIARQEDHVSTTGQYAQTVSRTQFFTAGDYVRIQVFQSSGGTLNVDTDVRTFVVIARVRESDA